MKHPLKRFGAIAVIAIVGVLINYLRGVGCMDMNAMEVIPIQKTFNSVTTTTMTKVQKPEKQSDVTDRFKNLLIQLRGSLTDILL